MCPGLLVVLSKKAGLKQIVITSDRGILTNFLKLKSLNNILLDTTYLSKDFIMSMSSPHPHN